MRLTIVTPTLNAERWLEECLESVRRESVAVPEVAVRHLVVDCGSTDDTLMIAEAARADVMRVEPRGLFFQINKGYRESDADVIGYLGGDDELLPGSVSVLYRWFRRPSRREWLVGTIRWTDAAGAFQGDVRPPPSWLSPEGLASLGWSCVPHQATFMTPRLFSDVGGFDESYSHVGDHDFFVRALKCSPGFDRTLRPLATFRRHGGNVSMAMGSTMREEMERIVDLHAPAASYLRSFHRLLLKLRMNGGSPGWFLRKKLPKSARLWPPRRAVTTAASSEAGRERGPIRGR